MTKGKSVYIVGGTGFLGYHAVQELLAKNWKVTVVGLPPASPLQDPAAFLFPASVKVIYQDIDGTSDADLRAQMAGHDVLIYASGADDRQTPRKPAYPFFQHANVETCLRILELARQAGVRRAVVLGSYFTHFNRLWPELRLADRHPYIRSRVEQEKAVMSIPGMDVDVLELPYIFGGMPLPGWKSLWTPLVRYIRLTPIVFYMQGGSACVTVRTVGQAIAGALEHGQTRTIYPIGDENLTWAEMLKRLAAADGRKIRVITLTAWMIKPVLFIVWLFHELAGKQGGLDPRFFASLQTAKTYLDPQPTREALGYETGGLDQAFIETVRSVR